VIEDQIPISQNTQIEVTALDVAGANYNVNTGKLSWNWNVATERNEESSL
jgi:hypothetical protein